MGIHISFVLPLHQVDDLQWALLHFVFNVYIAGVVTTLAGQFSGGSSDGNGISASFESVYGVANVNGVSFICDNNNKRIRAVSSTNAVTTFAGGATGSLDGIGTNAQFDVVWFIAVDSSQLNLYVTEQYGGRVRKICISTGESANKFMNLT